MNLKKEQIETTIDQVYPGWRSEGEWTGKAYSFKAGAEWAIEQIQLKWITVTGIADLPTDNKSYWCEVNGQVILLDADYMRRGTGKINRYTPFVKPTLPKQ